MAAGSLFRVTLGDSTHWSMGGLNDGAVGEARLRGRKGGGHVVRRDGRS